ncbi:uncharacterized protein B0T15DRAFT_506515 [Chaetomium strumarium]|uniref:Uncharacterized protein n=1 Tax=Chaetomium strumarium TaxID=1170767 RepID=A0AAJ0H0X0_9PEZI|nr:hypothetical protein B0T15DRAFT_506515 [Chaetomium strumarium]
MFRWTIPTLTPDLRLGGTRHSIPAIQMSRSNSGRSASNTTAQPPSNALAASYWNYGPPWFRGGYVQQQPYPRQVLDKPVPESLYGGVCLYGEPFLYGGIREKPSVRGCRKLEDVLVYGFGGGNAVDDYRTGPEGFRGRRLG